MSVGHAHRPWKSNAQGCDAPPLPGMTGGTACPVSKLVEERCEVPADVG